MFYKFIRKIRLEARSGSIAATYNIDDKLHLNGKLGIIVDHTEH
jgi:hypothetical protein